VVPVILRHLTLTSIQSSESLPASTAGATAKKLAGHGIVREVQMSDGTIVIVHETIFNYMAAMMIPFDLNLPHQKSPPRTGYSIFQTLQAGTKRLLAPLNIRCI
jgi:hypothetical protein